MAEKSNGKTLAANIALLENNARIAAQIAVQLSDNQPQ
jgi:pseudouridine-5'-phosphate glycosidase